MPEQLGDSPRDRLAYELSQTDYDAVERDGYRAEWTADDRRIVVHPLEDATDVAHPLEDATDVVVYDADDLVIAASDVEVQNARTE